MGSGDMPAWQLLIKGGPVMGPIFLCSVAALTVFIEKLFYFESVSTDIADLKHKIFECLKDNKLKNAIVICEQNNSPVAKVIKAGLIRSGAGRAEIKESMEEVSLYEIPKLEKRLNVLATIAHTSLLLGFLGTVVGMAEVFHSIEVRSTSMTPVTPGDLAGGIWQALLTTIFGLCVAIPTFLAYNYCISRVNDFVIKMERAATELINMLSQLSEKNTNAPEGELEV
jgi:biopolymer transport protein ExbB